VNKKNKCSIRASKKSHRNLLSHLDETCRYSGHSFGLPASLTGNGVSICIIDSGQPDHPDIKDPIDVADFRPEPKDKIDRHGHATMIGGILSSNNPRAVKGICPNADIMYAKVIDSSGECSHKSVVAAVLWGIIKRVDIILISLGSTGDYPVLRDALAKAERESICIVAADSNVGEVEYPASYPSVLSVGKSKKYKRRKSFKYTKKTGVEMILPDYPMYTTYLGGKYTTASGTSLNAAISVGLLALLMEKHINSSTPMPNPQSLYSEVGSLSYNPIIK
jgi:subtilisin family serine protease